MNITWLGQAGLLIEKNGLSIMVDPYLSNSVAKVNPANERRVPVDGRFLELSPDVLIFTHDHLDHYDPETAHVFLQRKEKGITVLCPSSVWQRVRTEGGPHNYVQFNRHTEWTERGFRFTAVKAEHSDAHAIGVVIEDAVEQKVLYIAGDTLYNGEIFHDLPEKIDVAFLPVNGVGNNMNMEDAARFAERTGAKQVVPVHFGLFDGLNPEAFACKNRIIPEIWKSIPLE